MDKRKSVLNVTVSIGFKLLTMVMVIAVKRMLIRTCGNEVNGLNALYLSIIGVLAVAELGVGSAITFCMYKPIVEQDNDKVSALYGLFRRLYRGIGGVILLAGLCLCPFLHYFAADYVLLEENLYVTFVLMLVSVVVTYFFGAETALINAYKNDYITTAITSGGIVLQYILQILVLAATGSFAGYLACRIVAAGAQWVATAWFAGKHYRPILANRQTLDADTRRELAKNIKAMFMHKVGTMLVVSTDGVVISAFVGVVALGEYSNYTTILAAMTGVIKLIFTSLTAVIGHLYVEKDKATVLRHCRLFHGLNFLIGTTFYLGYYAVIDDLIAILFSADLIASKSISFVIALNGFVQFMRSGVLLFRDATGTFYYDRWKPLAEGVTNVVLSILFIKWFGVTGVIAATIVTNLIICHVVEPRVLYKYAFGESVRPYYLSNYGMIALFCAGLALLHFCMRDMDHFWLELLTNGCISVGISAGIGAVLLVLNTDLRRDVFERIRRR